LKKRSDSIKRVGLMANPEKVSARPLLRRVARALAAAGKTVVTDPGTASLADLSIRTFPDLSTLAKNSDLLIVFGGDGTMLSVARAVAGLPTPILGVNIGGLGFLTAVPSSKIVEQLPRLFSNDFLFEERSLLQARGKTAGQELAQVALNDFVISRGATSRLVDLQVRIDSEPLTNYRCDGLIISSPTGSTAYSLAAGGAIVSPTAPVLTITPICPHTLSNRSVIISSDCKVQVEVLSQKLEIFLTADGQVQAPMFRGDTVEIQASTTTVRLVRFPESSFFKTLRQKLNWSGSNI
jgi:NAD+ kinase